MSPSFRLPLGLVLAVMLGACSKDNRGTGPARDLSQFQCNERQVGYTIFGGMAADEAGITMECGGDDPRIVRWISDGAGQRKNKKFPLTAGQFDTVWERIDATGWRQLKQDCNNSAAEKGDPSYLLEVADHAMSVMLNCDGKTLPFPYDRIVNELDLRAAGFGEQDRAVR